MENTSLGVRLRRVSQSDGENCHYQSSRIPIGLYAPNTCYHSFPVWYMWNGFLRGLFVLQSLLALPS